MGRETASSGIVVSVSREAAHTFTKRNQENIRLLRGLGVEGDAHMGLTVKHRSRIMRDPTHPNLRQVHLIHEELHDELRAAGFDVTPGAMGENITTRGIALLTLPRGTRLGLGDTAVVELTGLRNPCSQLNKFRRGLMEAVLDRADDGTLIRKAGVMAVVLATGDVRPGDVITVQLPQAPFEPLKPV